MPEPHDLLARVAADLSAAQARFAVVGGHAVSARTEPRFTRDLDLAVAVVDDREAERLVGSLVPRGYRVVALLEQETTKRFATVRLEHVSAPGLSIDLLFATAGVEHEVVAASRPLRLLAKLELPVASVAHLLAMKTLSVGRPEATAGSRRHHGTVARCFRGGRPRCRAGHVAHHRTRLQPRPGFPGAVRTLARGVEALTTETANAGERASRRPPGRRLPPTPPSRCAARGDRGRSAGTPR